MGRDKFTWYANDLIINRCVLIGTREQMLATACAYARADGRPEVEVQVFRQLVLRAKTDAEAKAIINYAYPVIT